MREILFRGQNKDGQLLYGERTDIGKWVYGSLVVDRNKIYMIEEIFSMSEIELEVIPIIPDTVGQYTGLKDCKGTRIFEGDIVRYGEFNHKPEPYIEIGYIIYKYGGFCIMPSDDFAWAEIDLEVIGNLWDTPELLEG